MEAVLGGALGRVPRRSPALIVAVALLGGICALGLGILGYRLAAASGGFDVQRVEVRGAADAGAVRAAVTRRSAGRSLLDIDPGAVARAVAALPTVQRATVDRAFPGTLSITVVPERPIAVAPGRIAISATGRVLGRAPGGLPVIGAAPADLPGPGGVVTSTYSTGPSARRSTERATRSLAGISAPSPKRISVPAAVRAVSPSAV